MHEYTGEGRRDKCCVEYFSLNVITTRRGPPRRPLRVLSTEAAASVWHRRSVMTDATVPLSSVGGLFISLACLYLLLPLCSNRHW